MTCDEVKRSSKTQQVTIPSGAALSDPFDFREWTGLIVHMPDTWTAAYVGFQVASEVDGTYVPLNDEDAAAVLIGDAAGPTQPVADEAYAAPTDLFPARFVKLWSTDGAGLDTNQAAERVLTLDLKG